jgi:hypothetical protein
MVEPCGSGTMVRKLPAAATNWMHGPLKVMAACSIGTMAAPGKPSVTAAGASGST